MALLLPKEGTLVWIKREHDEAPNRAAGNHTPPSLVRLMMQMSKETSLRATLIPYLLCSQGNMSVFLAISKQPFRQERERRVPMVKEVQDPVDLSTPFSWSGVTIKIYPPQTAAVFRP